MEEYFHYFKMVDLPMCNRCGQKIESLELIILKCDVEIKSQRDLQKSHSDQAPMMKFSHYTTVVVHCCSNIQIYCIMSWCYLRLEAQIKVSCQKYYKFKLTFVIILYCCYRCGSNVLVIRMCWLYTWPTFINICFKTWLD